jgi:hypothetical protein
LINRYTSLAQSRPRASRPPGVHGCIGSNRGAFDHIVGAGAQLFELGLVYHPFEDVKTVLPVCCENIRMQLATGIETQRTAVTDFVGQLLPRAQILRHTGSMVGGAGWRYGGCGQG